MSLRMLSSRFWKSPRSPKAFHHSLTKIALRTVALAADASTCAEEAFYKYTSGRWLWNEEAQFKARYVKFDIPALCDIAARSIGSNCCVEVVKLHEGNFNKALLLVMDDGKEVIAKIPNPNAGRPHFTTASEVETMDFASSSPVGAEYIIMEKMAGIPLATAWEYMHGRDRAKIIEQLVRYDAAFASSHFPAYGGLYYTEDIPVADSIKVPTTAASSPKTQFAVGPTNHRSYFDDGIGALSLDRGPWRYSEDFIRSNVRREQQSILQIEKKPLTQGLFNAPGQYKPSKKAELDVLGYFLQVFQYLLPKDEKTLAPVLWHSDLHTSNIFVDPDAPTKITGIIDWQAVSIAPLFLQVRTPFLLDFDGPAPPPGLDQINLPTNFDSLSPDEQHAAKMLQRDQIMHKMYEIGLLQHDKSAARALRSREVIGTLIIGMVANIFKDGEPVILGYLMRIVDEWASVASLGSDDAGNSPVPCPCPLNFTSEQREQQKRDEDLWSKGVELLADIRERLGVYNGWDGHVSHDTYEEMKKRVQEVREDFLQEMARTKEECKAWEKA